MCDVLVAGINSDEAIRAVKGPPIMEMDEKVEYLKHCKFVDEIERDTPYTPDV